jgi:hypothetical protein
MKPKTHYYLIIFCIIFFFSVILLPFLTFGQDDKQAEEKQEFQKEEKDLSKAIQNPIAAMISLPFQNNTDFGFDPGNKAKNVLNIQPVVPVGLGKKVNMVIRTIIPLISMPLEPLGKGGGRKFGLGDIALSVFFTPAKPGKLIWGIGPAMGFPTATDTVLGSQKWTAGPSVIMLVQPKGWTFGGLLQNTWSYAGNSTRADVNFFYSQIFITRNLPKGWYVNTAPIITANWNASSGNQWLVPLGAGFGKLFRIGKQPFNAQAGAYYFVVSPKGGPDWELRLQFNILFPKK